ncbi:MAG: ABC transporter permease [Actinomycetota bacterium]|nr:ABC transporter permease [Actinomycetota bacterium]
MNGGALEVADRRPLWRGTRRVVPALVALGVVAGIWQLIAVHNPLVLPTVGSVFSRLADQPGLFAKDAGATLEEVAVGAAAAFAAAFVIAVAMSELPIVERAVMPLAVALNVTPVVAIAPALTVMLGLSATPRYVVAAIVAFFPFLINALVGLRSVDPAVLELAQSLDAGRAEVLWRIRLPSSLPFLFAGARICLPLAVVGAVVAELTTSGPQTGLGYLIESAESTYDLPEIFAAVLVLAMIGVVLTVLLVLAERALVARRRGRA